MGKLLEQRNRALDDINAGRTVKKIRDLESRVRELEEENAELHEQVDMQIPKLAFAQLQEKLAASQLRAEQLREALEKIGEVASPYRDGVKFNYIADISQEALAITTDTSALDAYVAEKVKEKTDALHYRMEHCYSIDHVKIQCELDKITKQRDLAVEALENCRLLAARHRKEEWAGHIMRFCKDAGLSGSPIRNDAIKKSEAK